MLWASSLWMIVLPIEMIIEVLYPSPCMTCEIELFELAVITACVIALLLGVHVVSTEDFAKPLRMFLFGFPFVFAVLNATLRKAGGVGSTNALFFVAFFLALALLALGSSIMMARKFFFEGPITRAEKVLFFKEGTKMPLSMVSSRLSDKTLRVPNIPNVIEVLISFATILSFSAIPLGPTIRWEAFVSIRDFFPAWLKDLDVLGALRELLRYYLIDLVSYSADVDVWKLGFVLGVLVSMLYPRYLIRPVWQQRQLVQDIHDLKHSLVVLRKKSKQQSKVEAQMDPMQSDSTREESTREESTREESTREESEGVGEAAAAGAGGAADTAGTFDKSTTAEDKLLQQIKEREDEQARLPTLICIMSLQA